MRKGWIKILALVFVFTLCAGMFAACKNGGDKSTLKPGDNDTEAAGVTWEYELDTSPTTIDVWFPSVWVKDVWADGWTDEKAIFKHITEKTGVSLNVDIPVGTETELLGVMIAGDELPEVIVLENYLSPYLGQLRDGEYIYSWSELMEAYAPKMPELIDDTNWNFHTDDDGVLWGYVGFAYDDDGLQGMVDCGVPPVHEDNVMWVRNDILSAYKDKTGLDDITTLEQYTDLLYFTRENYPDIDPLRLFVKTPRSDLWTHMRSTFGACMDSQVYIDEKGDAKFYMYDPAYISYLSWLNDLYIDGVITQNMLTYDEATSNSKLYSAGFGSIKAASYLVYNTLEVEIKDIYGDDENYQYSPIGPIRYDENTPWYANATSSLGGQTTVITRSTDQPDRIIRFFEYLLTDEGQVTLNCGVEGDTWNYDENGNIVFTDEIKELAASDLNKYWVDYSICAAFSPWCDTWYWEHYLGSLITQVGSREYNCNTVRLASYRNYFNAGLIDISSAIVSGTDESVIVTKVQDLEESYAVRMIAAANKDEFNALYEECISKIEAENSAACEKIYTETYHGYCDDLGINYDPTDNETEVFGK